MEPWANDPGPPEKAWESDQGGERKVAEANCVRDKMKVEMVNPQKITMKNGKPAMKGTCPKCGNSVFRIGAG